MSKCPIVGTLMPWLNVVTVSALISYPSYAQNDVIALVGVLLQFMYPT